MSTIVLRSVKGTPLTNTEVDTNFSNLNTDKIQIGGTYSSGTTNGVLFLNASKVLTTGSALVFDGTNLGVGTNSPNADLEVLKSTEGQYMRVGGYSTGRSLTFTSGTAGSSAGALHTINASSGQGVIALATAGSERLRIDSSGNVGIGTSSPAEPLHVQEGSSGIVQRAGTVALIEGSANTKLTVASGATSTGEVIFGRNGDNDAGSVRYDHNTNSMQIDTNSTERMRIDSAGNVGIGTSSPTSKLVVSNAGALGVEFDPASGAMQVYNRSTSAYGTMNLYANTMYFRTGVSPSINMTLDASGNVGIGTSSPGAKLDVVGNARVRGSATPTLTFNDGAIENTLSITNSAFVLSVPSANPITFNTTNTERMRIDSSGNVGIGTSSPAVKLDVSGQIRASTGILFGTDTAAANALDDYEEGTWTPVVADASTGGNTGSATISYATYTKIGNQVTVTATLNNIDTTGLTAANIFHVRDLPFTSGTQQTTGALRTDLITYQGGRTTSVANVGPVDSWMTFLLIGSNLTDTNIDCGDLTSGTADMSFTITYFTA